jgi:hypothetical protein
MQKSHQQQVTRLHNSETNGAIPYGSISATNINSLINTKLLEKTIECAIISAYIKNEKPFSLLIVAVAESGKTTVMKQYRNNKGILYITDCTAYGITRDFLPKMVSGEIKTIMIPDLTTPLSKSAKTRATFIAFLNNLIEEGIAKITTYALTWDREVNANIITAVTRESLEDGRHEWAKMGFLSRLIVFSYSYNLATVVKIFNQYAEHGVKINNKKLKLPKKQIDIKLPIEIAEKLHPIAMKIGEQQKLYGFRALINFRVFLKALAYRNKRKTVTMQEFNEFLELSSYLNYDFNPL